MQVGWDYKLKNDERSNPVVFICDVDLPKDVILPSEQALMRVFQTNDFRKGSGRLTTWGREVDRDGNLVLQKSAHWIAVRNGTPLHVDPRYPRYSHHLKVRCDKNIAVRGLDKKESFLSRGSFYILDTHSPHQVVNHNKYDVWNVAVSVDSDHILNADETIEQCLKFLETADFI